MKYFFRFNPQPSATLPLTVRSVYENDCPAGTFRSPAHKPFTSILWTESGVGEIRVARRWVPVRGAYVLFPGESQDKRAVTRWKFYTLTLDHPESRRWVETMGLSNCPGPKQACPVKLFRAVQREVRLGTVAGDRRASHLVHAILLEATNRPPTSSEHHATKVEKCLKCIDTDFANPQLNIETIAQDMGMHRTTLFRAFMASQGMTPSHYLQNRRMHHAMQLLKQTDLPIKEVSIKSGYTDGNYFARVLNRMTGLPPNEFREAYRRGEPTDAFFRSRLGLKRREKKGKA